MRSRLVIPAALLMVAAYAKGRRDAVRPPAPSWWPAAPEPPAAPERAAAAEAAATVAPDAVDPAPAAPGALDLALGEETAPEPAGAAVAGRPTAPFAAPGAERVLESGRFTLGGWAAAAGHGTLCGLTFRNRLGDAPPAHRVRLVVEVADNVPDGGVVVLADEGFAPDAEGFAIMAVAAAPGAFAVAGRYELLAA